jgi:7,8-dihydropterin-6-yl-methyl-4-(beta-D-ribofuranosyl)aminobenzene 5'-phosphate synthase
MKARSLAVLSMLALVGLVAGCVPGAPRTATPTIAPTPGPVISPKAEAGSVTFTVVFDNYAHDPALETDWGFACLVEADETTVLFDTGADGDILVRNMRALGKDPAAVDAVVFSHEHGDHTAGLYTLLDAGAKPTIFAPSAFGAALKDAWRERTQLVEIPNLPTEILPGFYSTGFLTWPSGSQTSVEQALIVQTGEGWVMVTGCAHPGVVRLARRACEATGDGLSLVMGGFHLVESSADRISGIIEDLRELGVQKVAPSHCSGDRARSLFAEALGDDYVPSGAGYVITIGH